MKKKRIHGIYWYCARPSKIYQIMKLTWLFLFVAMWQVSASSGYSQSKKLNISGNNLTLEEVFLKIEDQSDFSFIYNLKQVDLSKKVNVDFRNQKVDDILTDILNGSNITFTVNDRLIVVHKGGEATDLLMSVAAQQRTISGTVTDNQGGPLPGASIIVKGTTEGTITNSDGAYTLANVPNGAILVFSFVGMKSQEVVVGNETIINISMEMDAIGLQEVVAIGYGTQNKQAVTGAVAVAELEKYSEVPVNNILETVKGTVAGLSVGATNTAGGVAGLQIRGQNSTGAGNAPLIVVDGAIYHGSISDIGTNDIENFTVLKDASAAAVYGARSANGVIIIETKKGKGIEGKPKFDVKMSYGFSDELKPLEVYDGAGYIQRLMDIRQVKGLEADPDKIPTYLQLDERNNYLATPDHQPTITDPYSFIRQNGYNRKASLSVSNSTAKSNYYISSSVTDQKGVVLNDEFKQLTTRININSDLADWFNIGIRSSYSIRDFSGSSPGIYYATQMSPYASVYNEDGSYKKFPQTTGSFISPFWVINDADLHLNNNLNGILTGLVKVPWVDGLTYTMTFSNSLRWSENDVFLGKQNYYGQQKNAYGSRGYSRSHNMLLDNIIKYRRTFKEKHNVDVTLLYSRESNLWKSTSSYAEDFDNSALMDYKLEDGKTHIVNTGGGESASIGEMARASYTFDHRYTLTGTFRRDGFSAFSKNKKWGTFASAGLNWVVSNESFLKNVEPIDKLAIRFSYGSNGNQSISPYSTLAKVTTGKYVAYGESSYILSQYVSSFANNDLGWEKTTGINMGINFQLFNNRISGDIDLYKTGTTDQLFSLALPVVSGKGSILSNLGKIENKGIEIGLHTVNVQQGNFKWSSDFSFSLNRNKVVTIYGEDNDGDGVEDDLVSSGYFIGRSLGTIYSYKVIGMWQQEDLDNSTIMDGMHPGEYKLEDVPDENGDLDGKITSTNDRQFLGVSKPNFRWSWTNTFEYKDFSMMFYLYSIWGGNGYYLSGSTPIYDGYIDNPAINHPVYDYWTPNNTGAEFPKPNYLRSAAYKGRKYRDRSFIKLQKISLSYNLTRFVKPIGIQGMTVSVSGDNLYTYAPHWIGLDPETGQGVNDTSRPSIRTYLFSLGFNF